MPKRQSTKRVDTPEVQAPDGFIELRSLTFEENQDYAQKIKALQDELGINPNDPEALGKVALNGDNNLLDLINERIAACIRDWNWVDDYEKPLPLPSSDLSVFERLTGEEYQLLIALIGKRDSEAAEARKKK